jgi:N6-L-threonylcarbamoyladenine synthase
VLILAIETSCDETSAAVVENGTTVLTDIISSQIAIHRPFRGVVPELASRTHVEHINKCVTEALLGARCTMQHINAIACTKGPGLAGSLLVGYMAARTLALIYKKPLIEINHLEGHLYSALIEHPALKPPYLGLVVSGGHTELIIMKDYGRYNYLGGTRDDAAGEAFDKVAKLLGLPYPGGPQIDKCSKHGNGSAIKFTRPYLWGSWDFSFSGIKTAVVNYVSALTPQAMLEKRADICASFQQAVVDTLVEKTLAAAKRYKLTKIALGGGVSSNSLLRAQLRSRCLADKISCFIPKPILCTDNAAMVGCVAYYKQRKNKAIRKTTGITPSLKLENW